MIPADLYHQIEQTMPILCVDFLMRRIHDGQEEIGLIKRHSPYGEVWCHLGGRMRRGETVAAALQRHFHESVDGASLVLPADPQPDYVYQWFPDDLEPDSGPPVGRDPRKHSVALSFLLDVTGEPQLKPGGEAIDLNFGPRDAIPGPLWPGCEHLFAQLLAELPDLGDAEGVRDRV